MKNKYEIENDEYRFGDIVRPIQVAQGAEAWDYFWRDVRCNPDWITGATDTTFYFSSKEAAKRGISRLVKLVPEAWEGAEFIVAKIEAR